MINSCAAILIAAKHGELTKVRDASGITYTVGTLRCSFDFRTSDWDYTTRKAIFCKGNVATNPVIEDKAIGVYLDKNNECAVPPEVLLPDEKYFSVGVWGATKEGLRIVSEWLVFKIKDGCYVDSVESIPPTPTVYEQIVAELSSKSPIDHNHDDKYYSQEYIDNKLENILSDLDVYTEFQEDIQESLTEAKAYTDEISAGKASALYVDEQVSSLSKSIADVRGIAERADVYSGTVLTERVVALETQFPQTDETALMAYNASQRAEEGLYNLTQEVGNIGAVLDELHAYAQGFIGGGE